MCGISALYRFTEISDLDLNKMNLMNNEMQYRGPDDSGTWNDNVCALAQVRLSIIGLEKGKQPLFNEDNSLVLICNGEIYNYIELRNDLIAKGHFFNSDSDSETILHLYEEYGEECLKYLRGMFAFCLWDTNKKQLFAARDRIGEKTLYYSQLQTGIVLSTELKTILKNFIDNPQINLHALAEPIRYTSPIDSKNTFVEQIVRLLPGHYLIINEKGFITKKYWEKRISFDYEDSKNGYKEKTLNLMRESVDICLRSDVPVAVMLSGGIDSSAIAALAKETGREVHTITAGYKGQFDCDERDVARRFAKERGFIYHEVELDENDFRNCFDEFTQFIDEPITDIAALPQWALYKKVKSLGFKVLLGGMGGDELFYGYDYWNKLSESWKIQNQHFDFFPWKGIEKKINFMKFIMNNLNHIFLAGYPFKIEDKSIGYWTYEDYFKFSKNANFKYNSEKHNFADVDLDFHFKNIKELNETDRIYDFLFSKTMTMAYLYLSDRLGMGNSVEIRSPLLDYKLVEYVTNIPFEYKYNKKNPKYFLKELLNGIVPDYILHATKRGFTPPGKYVNEISVNYQYKFFESNFKFYNAVLADRMLSLNIK